MSQVNILLDCTALYICNILLYFMSLYEFVSFDINVPANKKCKQDVLGSINIGKCI